MQIVYYSLTGHAERVARQLADMLDLPLYRIEDTRQRKGAFGFIRSGYESRFAKSPAIRLDGGYQPDADHVILVAPIWAGRMCSPLRAFCQQNAGKFQTYSLILTHADAKTRFQEVCGEITAMTGARCQVFDSFCIQDIAPARITALGSQLAGTARA